MPSCYRQYAIPLLCLLVPLACWGVPATAYRQQAEAALKAGEYAKAAECYQQEAAVYRAAGDVNAAKVESEKAERWRTEMHLFSESPPDAAALRAQWTGAKYEPLLGCYLGAYVETDDELNGDGYPASREQAFGRLLHKPLATAFHYHFYGEPFPTEWTTAMRESGMAPQIALEPNHGLDKVADDEYLRQFARDAAAVGGPIFLRFASEMNGDWTPYHGNPPLYRQKFRLVHDVMARLAPNVAMIWCPNHIPESTIDAYYPGDAAVDWVGVNFYSVGFHDNRVTSPGFYECPTMYLHYVYQHYAARKPIAICEYGASHFDTVRNADRSNIAALRFAQLLTAFPRLYPRVKMFDIFDNNNMKYAPEGRQLNDYCVTETPTVLQVISQAVSGDYYLSKIVDAPTVTPAVCQREVTDGAVLTGVARLSAWVKSYDNAITVVFALDGKEIDRLATLADYRTTLDTHTSPPGPHTLTLTVLDAHGHCAGTRSYHVIFRRPT